MKNRIFYKKIMVMIVVLAVIMRTVPVTALSFLTKEEQEYIQSRDTIKAISIDGVAPLQYYDANGQVKGISRNVLDTVSELTGLKFSYQLLNNIDEVMNSNADIIFGVLEKNQFEDLPLSVPY